MTEAVLSKTRSVLDRLTVGRKSAYYDYPEGEMETSRLTAIDLQTYEDLGRPEQITVTITPGDTLTPEYEAELQAEAGV